MPTDHDAIDRAPARTDPAPVTARPPALRKGTVLWLGCLGMAGWLLTFAIGVLISSKPYRDQLAAEFDWLVLLKALISYTPTNVALLCALAGFIGGCASLMLYGTNGSPNATATPDGKPAPDEERLTFLTEHPVSSAVRGFAVFLMFLAGTVMGANEPFVATTQDQYCRMAGAVAVLAFAVGYDPTFFRQFISSLPRKKDG